MHSACKTLLPLLPVFPADLRSLFSHLPLHCTAAKMPAYRNSTQTPEIFVSFYSPPCQPHTAQLFRYIYLYTCNFCTFQLSIVSLNYFTFYIGNIFKNVCQAQKKAPCLCSMKPFFPENSDFSVFYFFVLRRKFFQVLFPKPAFKRK